MTLSAAAICLALAAAPLSPVDVAFGPGGANPAATQFDRLPPAKPAASDDARLKRFLGALAGGVVGLGGGLALMATGDASCSTGFGVGVRGCITPSNVIFGVLTPLLTVTGTWLGFTLGGGDAGPLAAMGAMAPAILLALALSSVAGQADASGPAMLPYVLGSGAVLIGLGALGLEARHRQLEALGGAANFGSAGGGRVTVSALVAAFTVAGTFFASLGIGAIGFGQAPFLVLAGLNAALGTVAVAAATWGVHRAMGGRGSFGSALAGLGIGWLVSLAGVGLWALQNSSGAVFDVGRNTGSTILWVQLLAAAAMFGPVMALEWSHTEHLGAVLPKVQFSAAPTAHGGGMVGAAVRF